MQESPLLRLPAELKDQIWELAFGWRTLHPRGEEDDRDWDPVAPRTKEWHVSYFACQQSVSDREIYDMSLEGASDDKDYIWKSSGLTQLEKIAKFHRCGLHYGDLDGTVPSTFDPTAVKQFNVAFDARVSTELVPSVCKQFLAEALPIAWKTTNFAFARSGDFQHFIQAPNIRCDLVQYLSFVRIDMHIFIDDAHRLHLGWYRACTSPLSTAFTSLRGLNLTISSQFASLEWNGELSKSGEIHYFIRLFRTCPLVPTETTVFFLRGPHSREPISKKRILAEKIRELLLQGAPKERKPKPKAEHSFPLRRSKRTKTAE
jgi:hypothetical protein